MSRGFVKEEDQEEAPIIPPRAALPEGVTNYVTPQGLKALQEERKELENERANLSSENETERRRAAMLIDGKLNLLVDRLSTAQVIAAKDQPKDEVRFGALVKFKMNGNTQKFQIVGVDEADVKQQKIAFTAPIAKALNGKKVGEEVAFKLGNENRKIEILEISYS